MKLSEILAETPYLHPGEMPRVILDGSYSLNTIKREFGKQLGVVGGMNILIDTHASTVIGIPLNGKLTAAGRVLPTFALKFKHSNLITFKHLFPNVIQVDVVAVDPFSGNKGVASSIYKKIVDAGYTLVSDVTQYDTAKALWKKIATDTSYKMYVADVDHGLFKDEDGQPIVYDGNNIADDQIWSMGSDFDGQYRVLILTK